MSNNEPCIDEKNTLPKHHKQNNKNGEKKKIKYCEKKTVQIFTSDILCSYVCLTLSM